MSSVVCPPAPASPAQALLEQARQLIDQRRLLDAAKVYRQVLDHQPACLEAVGQLGSLFYQLGQPEAALACLQQAVRLEPKAPKLQLLTGAVLKSLGRLEESAACCERATWLDPADADARYNLGLVLQSSGRHSDAVESFEQAVRLRADYADAWAALGTARRQTEPANPGNIPADSAANRHDAAMISAPPAPLYYPGQTGGGFGWGVCNGHLIAELSRLMDVRKLEPGDPLFQSPALPGDLFVPLGGGDFRPFSPARGRRNFGYVFFEQELSPQAVERARTYDLVFAGSTWCRKRMEERGMTNCALLIQGVDTRVFHPDTNLRDGPFVLFSGGKFELRKGQDLVLKAFAALSGKYPDLRLVTAWHNPWPDSMKTMAASPHIRFETAGGGWVDQMEHVYRLNGVDPSRVTTLPSLGREAMAQAYHASDLGLFPNRCEGGTNLVLMEYMACGKPAIVTYASGHQDICRETNSLPLRSLRPFVQRDLEGRVVNRWVEPSLEEIIDRVEYAYAHRAAIRALGAAAAADMRQWSWQRAAQTIVAAMGRPRIPTG